MQVLMQSKKNELLMQVLDSVLMQAKELLESRNKIINAFKVVLLGLNI